MQKMGDPDGIASMTTLPEAAVTAPGGILCAASCSSHIRKDAFLATVRDGARGVVFGRNLVGAKDPVRFMDALREVVKLGADPAAAAAKHGLA